MGRPRGLERWWRKSLILGILWVQWVSFEVEEKIKRAWLYIDGGGLIVETELSITHRNKGKIQNCRLSHLMCVGVGKVWSALRLPP